MLNLDDMLSDLRLLVETESPSRDVEALNKSADVLSTILERRLGSQPHVLDSPAGPHLHWTMGERPRVLIVGHHDTVFPKGTLADRPFRLDGTKVHGPGVFDMKAGIVQAIHALANLDDRAGVEIFLSSDEEVGSGTSRDLIVERAQACGVAFVLEPSADGGALKTARKGTGTFDILIHGRASHAGLEPEKGVNALIEAASQVLRIANLGDPERGTTVTPTVATVGTADNVVPALARILVDVRAEDPLESARVDTSMRSLKAELADAWIEVGGGFNRPPMTAATSQRLFAIACDVARDLGLGTLSGVAVGGGSDGNFTAAAGVETLDGLGAVGGGAHADHEWVEVSSMIDRTKLLSALVDRVRTS